MSFGDAYFISETLDSALATVADALDAVGRPVDKVHRTAGRPPQDCEQLTAWATHSIIPAVRPDTKCVARHAITVSVQLLRCVITSAQGIPTSDEMDTDGEVYAIDMWVMAKALARWNPVGCSRITFSGVTAGQLSSLSEMTATVLVELN